MKKMLIIFILALTLLSLSAVEEWNQPAHLAEYYKLQPMNNSIEMPNGIISSALIKNVIYAQFTCFDGVNHWSEEGVRVSDILPETGQMMDCKIIPSDTHTIFIAWIFNDFVADVYTIHVQKVSLTGELLWEESVALPSNASDIVFFQSDRRGGFYISTSNTMSEIMHVSASAEVSNPFSGDQSYCSDFHVAGDGTFYLLKDNDLIKYNHIQQVLWTRATNLMYKKKITEMDNGHIIVTGTDYSHLKGRRFSQEGQNLWNVDGVELLSGNGLNGYSAKACGNNLIIACNRYQEICLLNISPAGTPVWTQPLSFGNLFETDRLPDLIISPDNQICISWIDVKMLSTNYYLYEHLFQKINTDGSLYWQYPLVLNQRYESYYSDALPFTLFRNNHIYYITHTKDFKNILMVDKNPDEPFAQSSQVIALKANPGDISTQSFLWNEQHTLYVWLKQTNLTREIYYQLLDNQGNSLLEEEGKPLFKPIDCQNLLETFKDEEGNFYIVWANTPHYNLSQYAYFSDVEAPDREIEYKTYIQKINGQTGELMYPDKGIVLFPDNTYPQMITRNNEQYFYFYKYNSIGRSYDIYMQKFANDAVQWDMEGRLILENTPGDTYYFQLPCPGENVILKVNTNKDIYKLYRSDSEGNLAENWPADGVEIFRNSDNMSPVISVWHQQNTFLCVIAYNSNQVFYTVLDENGNILKNKELLIYSDDDSYFTVNLDNRLYVTGSTNTGVKKWVFEYQSPDLIPVYDTYQYMTHPALSWHPMAFNMHNRTLVFQNKYDNFGFFEYSFCLMFDENGIIMGEPVQLFMDLEPNGCIMNPTKINNESLYAVVYSNYHYYLQKLNTLSFTDTESQPPLPSEMSLSRNYPNPFNPTTKISYTLKNAVQTELSVYNIKGQKVTTLVKDLIPAGTHEVVWNGKDKNGASVSSGVYFYRLQSDTSVITKKMILMK